MKALVRSIYWSKAFWAVLATLLVSIAATPLAPIPPSVPIPPEFIFQILFLAVLAGLWFFQRSLATTHYGYVILQMIFVWIGYDTNLFGRFGFSFKPHILAVVFAVVISLVNLFKDFSYYWKFFMFRCIFLFFIANIFYFGFYHSDFLLSSVAAGYPVPLSMMTEAEANASTIMFTASMAMFIATVCGLAVFRADIRGQLQTHFEKLVILISMLCSAYFFLVFASGFKSGVPGGGFISGIMFFVLLSLSLWVFRERPELRIGKFKLTTFLIATLAINFLFLFIAMNKTTLIGFILTSTLLLGLNYRYGVGLPVKSFLLNLIRRTENKIILLITVGFVTLIFAGLGVFDLIGSKLDYFSRGFSTLSTLSVRTGNWSLFWEEWRDTLNAFRLMFGYGTGQSRETIFFLSVMRQAGAVTLVQTLHNTYLEFLYDYGLVSLLYYAAFIHLIRNNIRSFLIRDNDISLRVLGIMSLCLIVFVGIYGLMDGIRVQVLIVFFSALAFVESYRSAIERTKIQALLTNKI
jgi:hypothetical protein